MAIFKAAVMSSQLHKSKGDWIVKSDPPVKTSTTPPTSPSKPKAQPFTFLLLPGEIRNTLYSYAFAYSFIADFHPAKGSTHLPSPPPGYDQTALFGHRYTVQALLRMRKINVTRPMGTYTRFHGRRAKWATSFHALLLTCKQVHEEATPYLYRATCFMFASFKPLNTFLRITPHISLLNVRHLDIRHATMGDPLNPRDEMWKEKHTTRWRQLLQKVVLSMPNLTRLRLTLYINDFPLRFRLGEAWVCDLLILSSLTSTAIPDPHSNPLLRESLDIKRDSMLSPLVDFRLVVESRLSHENYFADKELKMASQHLHRLFAEAVRRYILGWEAGDAMVEYNGWAFGSYLKWRDHLCLNP